MKYFINVLLISSLLVSGAMSAEISATVEERHMNLCETLFDGTEVDICFEVSQDSFHELVNLAKSYDDIGVPYEKKLDACRDASYIGPEYMSSVLILSCFKEEMGLIDS